MRSSNALRQRSPRKLPIASHKDSVQRQSQIRRIVGTQPLLLGQPL